MQLHRGHRKPLNFICHWAPCMLTGTKQKAHTKPLGDLFQEFLIITDIEHMYELPNVPNRDLQSVASRKHLHSKRTKHQISRDMSYEFVASHLRCHLYHNGLTNRYWYQGSALSAHSRDFQLIHNNLYRTNLIPPHCFMQYTTKYPRTFSHSTLTLMHLSVFFAHQNDVFLRYAVVSGMTIKSTAYLYPLTAISSNLSIARFTIPAVSSAVSSNSFAPKVSVMTLVIWVLNSSIWVSSKIFDIFWLVAFEIGVESWWLVDNLWLVDWWWRIRVWFGNDATDYERDYIDYIP